MKNEPKLMSYSVTIDFDKGEHNSFLRQVQNPETENVKRILEQLVPTYIHFYEHINGVTCGYYFYQNKDADLEDVDLESIKEATLGALRAAIADKIEIIKDEIANLNDKVKVLENVSANPFLINDSEAVAKVEDENE